MWTWLILLSAACAQTELLPGTELRLSVSPSDSLYFVINHSSLRKDSKYEVRVSYLGTVGASLSLSWEPCSLTSAGGVKMLDTDKLTFVTDTLRNIEGQYCPQYLFRLRAMRISRTPTKQSDPIWFNIVLEHYAGPVPESVVGIGFLLFSFVPFSAILCFALVKGDCLR